VNLGNLTFAQEWWSNTERELFKMAARSKKNIAVGTQQGEGQVSQRTVVPISASSFTQPAEAGSNVEAGVFPISMPGATCVPAPNETAVSQFQFLDGDPSSKETEMLKRLDGGVPPVVGRKPTGSDNAAQLYLHPKEWDEEVVLETAESMFGIDLTSAESVDFCTDDCSVELGHCVFADGAELQVWTQMKVFVDYRQNLVHLTCNELGDMLANYQYGGIEAVDAYFASLIEGSDEELEGSESLAANSPEHVHIDSALDNGDGDE
jgi:hypothetical protein